ncbi:MAG TPA: 3-dehydroquinate synthase II [Methanoregulaceae archaeon]|nr:3-dehydroquinate synthase II [Methanoregulaceae archaeon]HOV67407.1 3-dehydroquinate synthase II [Methanoregulaceae archaeon]HQJ87436.1 3-dehydroquinate synthase II [Methanoregulaceae archaeon]
MKALWVEVRPFSTRIATAALEAGADAIVTDEPERVRALGRVTTVGPGGDLEWDRDVFAVTIASSADEDRAVELARQGIVVVETSDWTVIPLENLVARSDRVFARVTSEDDALLALGVLETGVAGLLLSTDDPGVVARVAALVKGNGERIPLVPLRVESIRPIGMGDRVCVDTCSLFGEDEGLLVGNTSSALFLVHAETLENPYVAPRPFRVNAGAVHAYCLLPGGRTAYLADLSAGDAVLGVGARGCSMPAAIGRVKIERRPLLLVEAVADDGRRAGIVLQNAETIRLVREGGGAVSVAALQVGDRVLGALLEGGRHFGHAVRETIRER